MSKHNSNVLRLVTKMKTEVKKLLSAQNHTGATEDRTISDLIWNIQLDEHSGLDIAHLPIIGNKAPQDDKNNYWAKRSNDRIYLTTILFAHYYCRGKETVADVGCHVSPLVLMLPNFKKRYAFDPSKEAAEAWKGVDGATFVNSPLDREIVHPLINDDKFDLVLCNQVIEHLEEPAKFAHMLCDVSRCLILSTTFETPAGLMKGHVQDPISLEKFESWFPRKMQHCFITRGPRAGKILAVF